MARKKSPTVINEKRRPKSPMEKYLDGAQSPLIPPAKVNQKVVATRSLSRGSYQRKLLAFFAPVMFPELLNAIRRGIAADDPQVLKLASEIFNLIKSGKAGVTVNVDQKVDNRSAHLHAESADDMMSFEDIARLAGSRRQQRIAAGTTVMVKPEFIPTPEE